MNIFKSLIGSLIGAAVAIGIYFAAKQATGETYVWFPLVIGLLTGVAARVFSGKSASNFAGYVCGAFAGLIAGCAIFGVDIAAVMIANNSDFGPVKIAERLASTENDSAAGSEKSKTTRDGQDSEPTREGESGPVDELAAQDQKDSDPEQDREPDNDDSGKASPRTTDINQSFKDRGRATESGRIDDNSGANSIRFADIVKTKSRQTWFEFYLPYVLSGFGVLLAYQLARGFGSGPKT